MSDPERVEENRSAEFRPFHPEVARTETHRGDMPPGWFVQTRADGRGETTGAHSGPFRFVDTVQKSETVGQEVACGDVRHS